MTDACTTPELRIRLGGPAGFGIKAAGQSLSRVFARAGYHTFDLTEYPSLIKGGHNTYHLRVSARPIHSHALPTDVLVALDAPTIALHAHELTPGAAVIYDPAAIDADGLGPLAELDTCLVPVALKEIVYDLGGELIMRNTAALGAVLGHVGFPLESLTDSIREQFAHKDPSIAEKNIAIATRGFDTARANPCGYRCPLPAAEEPTARPLLDGNEAVGLGALAAGVGLYAAYPMTPASTLLHFMARHGEKHGVVVKHTEDEIAAMNMVVGSAFGGTRSFCATSGGGFSLMVEALGFAGVSESPVVVGLFTRPGPATGMPTWTEQSDLRFAIHASQGEFPRVVIAPGTRAQCFELAWKAFNIADVFQTPVIILGDSYLSDHRATVDELDHGAVVIERGDLQVEGEVDGYLRYGITDSGISMRALPGVKGAVQLVNSYEHDERGWAEESAAMRVVQVDKRSRKLDGRPDLLPPPVHHGPSEAALSILCFGSTVGPALDAMAWFAAEGVEINILQVVTVCPFPAEEVCAFVDAASSCVVVEGDATAQLRSLVREHCLRDVDHSMLRYDGRPFSAEQLYSELGVLLGRGERVSPNGWDVAAGRAVR